MSGAAQLGVAVLGATGVVGERLVARLQGHPWLRLDEVVSSKGTAGRRYGDIAERAPAAVAALRLLAPGAVLRSPVVLSALPTEPARELEPEYAARGHLVSSNAAAFRQDARVPLLVPEINADVVEAVTLQPWPGALVTNPNCMVAGLALALAPLHRAFGLRAVTVVTMQALSGAGKHGLDAWQTHDNVVPDIAGEACKFAPELNRLLGAELSLSARANRVPVRHGHLASVFARFDEHATPEAARAALEAFVPHAAARTLPSAPQRPLRVLAARDRPQGRLDLDAGAGMTVSIGGIEADPVYDVCFSVLVDNLARGAAGACLLNAELLVAARALSYESSPAAARRSNSAVAPHA